MVGLLELNIQARQDIANLLSIVAKELEIG